MTDLIRYTESFGNDCENPFILENDKSLAELPTYMSWEPFWDTFHEPSPLNIGRLVSRFGLRTTRRPELNNVHPTQAAQKALNDANEQANFYIYPPLNLNLGNVLCNPLYRGK